MDAKAPEASFKWFRQARFGMFIHFGLYSILGRGEWAMFHERIPFTEYRKLALRFNPKKLRIIDWVRLAQKTGMRYMCLTTRHHDGFCLFNTQTTEFNSVQTAAGRDFVREYVDACHQVNMGVGLYYSVENWSDPKYIEGSPKNRPGWKEFVEVVHSQIKELMTNYGRIDYFFYDACLPPETWDCAEINAEIRRLQPDILISSRCGLDEDITSAEGYVFNMDPGKSWETCITSNNTWGYNYGDQDWKTAREIVKHLLTCAHNGGNFLLNVGPKGDGTIPTPAVRLLKQVGAWLQRNGVAVYGTEPHPFNYVDRKLSTGSGNTVYIPLHYYPGPKTVIAGIGNKVLTARILSTNELIKFTQEDDRVFLTGLPRKEPDPLFTVVTLELNGKPQGIRNPLLGDSKKIENLLKKTPNVCLEALERNFTPAEPIPKYYQIKKIIAAMILDGTLKFANQIPSAYLLAEKLGITKVTVDKALDELEREGLVKRIRGKGTFVIKK